MGRFGYDVVDADGHILETLEMHEQFRDHYLERPHSRHLGDMLQEMRSPQYAGRTGGDSSGSFLWTLRSSSPKAVGRWRALGLPRDQKVELPRNMATRTGSRAEAAPLDPAGRLLDMDLEGIDTAVIYPSRLNYYCAMDDVALETAIYRAYNRWMSDHCRTDPRRLRYIAVVSMRDIEAGVTEIRRSAEDRSMVGVYVSGHMDDHLLDDPMFYPLWEEALSLDLPIVVHGGTARPPYGVGTHEMGGNWFLQHSATNPFEVMRAMASLIGGGVLDRFPKLRFAFLEAGVGWLPYWLDRMDEHAEMMPRYVPLLKRSPRQAFMDGSRCFVSCDPDESTLEFVVPMVGEDRVIYASDYPHFDSRFPDTVRLIAEHPRLTDSAKKKILSENALRLYPRLA